MRWYRDKRCVYCSKVFQEVRWADHRPALLSPDGKLLAWNAVDLEDLQNVLETHSPVCWDCYIVQEFRLDHPDLVVIRPWRNDLHGVQTAPSHEPGLSEHSAHSSRSGM